MSKQWKQINEAPNYEISDCGDIRRLTNNTSGKRGRLLRPRYTDGYRTACLCIGGVPKCFRVHRLVMSNFVEPSDSFVNHKNGKRDDNRLENLEYCTQLENIHHSRDVLGHSKVGVRNPNAKLSEAMVREIFAMHAAGNLQKDIARRFSVARSMVCRILKRELWGHVSIAPQQ
jgi:hypothetical protein